MSDVGSVVFGPRCSPEEAAQLRREQVGRERALGAQLAVSAGFMCNCIGPQPGETKCPCALRVEMQQAQVMLSDGVTIAGKRYRLAPVD